MGTVFTDAEESQNLRQEQRIDRLEADSRSFQSKVEDQVADLKQKLYEVGVSIGKLEGSTQKRTPHPWVTPLITLAGAVLLGFWGWMATTVVQHGNTLISIRQLLLGQGVTIAAIAPSTPKAQDQAIAVLAEARAKAIPIAKDVIENAGKNFVRASMGDPKAWAVALDFVAYRSLLNTRPIAQFAAIPSSVITHYGIVAPLGKALPTVKWTAPIVQIGEAARWDLIGKDQNRDLKLEVGPQWLFATGGGIVIDNQHIRQVVFENVEIHYSGSSVILEGVVFINCKFVLENVPRGQQFAEQVLMSSSVDFKA